MPDDAPRDPAPYRFALRAFLCALCVAAFVAATDRAIAALHRRGITVLPKVPPPECVRVATADGKVALFGDSVMLYVPPSDQARGGDDARTLVQMLAAQSPLSVADLARPGRGPGLVAASAKVMARDGIRPAAAVVSVNLQMFGPLALDHPFRQEPDVLAMMRTGWYLPIRGLRVFKVRFGVMTADEYLDAPLVAGGRTLGTVRDAERPHPWFDTYEVRPGLARTRHLGRYGFDMDGTRALADLREALADLRAFGVPTLAVLVPIDVEAARAALTPDEMALIERNLAALRACVAESGARVLDLSEALPRTAFDHPDVDPDEHLHAPGRREVARRIAEELTRFLPPR